jgi:glucose-6-phosphate 1-dehydrogenase
VTENVVRGQYFAGEVDGESRPAYRSETKVKPNSNVETFLAMRLHIDNWRWSGVPFYTRTGKNLPLGASEVRIQFKSAPNILFAAKDTLDANSLTLRLQPDEGMTLRFNGKVPGGTTELRPVRMHFSYDSEFGAYTPEAYERLLLESMAGDATLFIRSDEVETAWRIVDAIHQAWIGKSLTNREFYAAGTWGPAAADDLLAKTGHEWKNPQPRH